MDTLTGWRNSETSLEQESQMVELVLVLMVQVTMDLILEMLLLLLENREGFLSRDAFNL